MHKLTFLLLIIGGLNWLVLGLFNWDIGMLFGGQDALISKIIYILVGLAAVLEMLKHGSLCKECGVKKSVSSAGPAAV